jgi:O-antigen/teichoic acid export membrane protein
MSVARKIFWNTVSQMAGKAAIAIMGIIVIKLITNYLDAPGMPPSNYGQYTAAFEFLAFFAIVADLGLYTIGVREMAKDEKKVPMIIGNMLTIRTVIAVLMVGSAIIAAYLLPQYQNTKIPFAVVLVGVATVLNLLTSTVSSVLQVHLKMQYNAWASVVGKVVSLGYMAIAIFVLFPGNKVEGFYHLIWAGIFGNGVMLGITYWYSRRLTHIAYRFDPAFLKDVIIKALPYGIALVLNTIYFRIGSVLLSLIKTPDDLAWAAQFKDTLKLSGTSDINMTDVGIYGVPMRMLEAVGIIPLYFMNAVLPVLTRSLTRKDGSHKRIIQYAFDFLVMGSLPIVAGTVVLAYPIIYIISKGEFLSNLPAGIYGSDFVLQILIFALAFSFINSLFGFILVADNRQTKLLIRNAIGAGLTLILDIIFIPYYGVRAAAFTNVLTECYVAFASYLIAKHYIKFKINLRNTFKTIFAAVVMAVVLYLLRDPTYKYLQNKNIFLLIPVGCAIYVAILFLTKAITKEMIAMIKKPKPAAPEEIEPPITP